MAAAAGLLGRLRKVVVVVVVVARHRLVELQVARLPVLAAALQEGQRHPVQQAVLGLLVAAAEAEFLRLAHMTLFLGEAAFGAAAEEQDVRRPAATLGVAMGDCPCLVVVAADRGTALAARRYLVAMAGRQARTALRPAAAAAAMAGQVPAAIAK